MSGQEELEGIKKKLLGIKFDCPHAELKAYFVEIDDTITSIISDWDQSEEDLKPANYHTHPDTGQILAQQ